MRLVQVDVIKRICSELLWQRMSAWYGSERMKVTFTSGLGRRMRLPPFLTIGDLLRHYPHNGKQVGLSWSTIALPPLTATELTVLETPAGAESDVGQAQFWKQCLQRMQQAPQGQQQRRWNEPPQVLEIADVKDAFQPSRAFLVQATAIISHGGAGSWTVGIPIAPSRANAQQQANWEDIPASLVQNIIKISQEDGCSATLKRHKAEEIHLGATIFYSQTCRSWRTEAQILNQDNKVLLAAYWRMGLRGQSKFIHGIVLRVYCSKALDVALQFIDNGEPLSLGNG